MEQQNQITKSNGGDVQPAANANKQPTNQQPSNFPAPIPREQKSSNHAAGQSRSSSQGAQQAHNQASRKPDATSLLKQTPVPPVLCDWLVCMRKPAISMQYSIQKRHVPDLDTDQAQKASADGTQKGVNSDTMGVQGDFTIRYFDLAAGMLAMVAVGCLIKGCCFVKRKIF